MNIVLMGALARIAAAFAILVVPCLAGAELAPIVIGQSLPLRGAAYFSAARILQATQTYVAQVNDSGGIIGRKLEVVTLDDDNDPVKLEANIRALIETHKAVAIMNCLGDILCERASLLAKELKLPLFGPISGAGALREPDRGYTIALRPRYDVQVEALVRQLKTIGVSRLVLLTSYPRNTELRATLVETLTRGGIPPMLIQIDESQSKSFDEAATRLRDAVAHAVVLDVQPRWMSVCAPGMVCFSGDQVQRFF